MTLTVLNFDNWCSVKVNGGMASTMASIPTSVTPGSTATIVATPASSMFQIGPLPPWYGIDENDGGAAQGTDNGSGTTETTTAMVHITTTGSTQCVSVCCQFPNNSPPCPTTDPCP